MKLRIIIALAIIAAAPLNARRNLLAHRPYTFKHSARMQDVAKDTTKNKVTAFKKAVRSNQSRSPRAMNQQELADHNKAICAMLAQSLNTKK